MRLPRPTWLHEALFHLLLIAIAVLLAWFSLRYTAHWDWSAQRRNSLAAESQALVERLRAPLLMTSFSPDNAQLRRRILRLLERYRRARPALIEIRFIDPELHPDQAREAGVELAGELLLDYQGRRERLRSLSEGHISNALQRLLGRPDQWIGALVGHGERRLRGKANHDLGRFGAALEQRGYRIQPLELARSADIPRNIRLLVIAGPRGELLDGEVQRLRGYLRRGGNLLWLLDPDGLFGLDTLAADLGVRRLPGRIVDANARALGIDDPSVALVTDYPDHPATQGLEQLSLYPKAAALESVPNSAFKATALLNTQPGSWNETGPIKGSVRRDAEQGERAGPLSLGYALERRLDDQSEQRVVVIGDGDFLANAFLDNAGNQALGLRLTRWLMAQPQLLQLPARAAPDRELHITRSLALVLGIGSLVILPLGFLLGGWLIHRRRRRD